MEIDELGRAGRYEELRRFLESSDYSEATICAKLGLRRLADFESVGNYASHLDGIA